MSDYHLIPIEAKQFFSSILVVFKIKLRKLCYTGSYKALCGENCIKITDFHRKILLKEIDVGKKILFLHVEDPIFIYPTIQGDSAVFSIN